MAHFINYFQSFLLSFFLSGLVLIISVRTDVSLEYMMPIGFFKVLQICECH